ncbi:hypothetical protein LCGC14_1705360 [marine sediment metagenome]|uniref:Uncharacterized protein n=1 Tax=marine sediment metagenome TaxID=412755 RepID=A0A0F9HHC6_9ZZZZ
MANKHVPESRYFLTELNDGIQWLTDGQDFGMRPAAARGLLEALEAAGSRIRQIGMMLDGDVINSENWQRQVNQCHGFIDTAVAAIEAAKGGVT